MASDSAPDSASAASAPDSASVVTVPASAPAPRKSRPTGLPENIVFYCKDCEKIGEVTRVGSRYVYTCNVCDTKNVAFGTLRSISRFFHLEEKEKRRAQEQTVA